MMVERGSDETDGDAEDDLVAAMGDRGETVHQREKSTAVATAAPRPTRDEPVTAAAEAPAKVPASILPSSPVSMTPARSE